MSAMLLSCFKQKATTVFILHENEFRTHYAANTQIYPDRRNLNEIEKKLTIKFKTTTNYVDIKKNIKTKFI